MKGWTPSKILVVRDFGGDGEETELSMNQINALHRIILIKIKLKPMENPNQVVNERAQVPGYCGYIPGKTSENKFGSTFGQLTKGAYVTQPEAFLTTNIATNAFIQQQHKEDSRFWGDQGKISSFQQPSLEPKKNNYRVEVPKFQPAVSSSLTYEQALRRAA